MGTNLGSDNALRNAVTPIVEALGYQTVDVAMSVVTGRRHVNLVVYKNSGVSVDDCAAIHKTLLPRLEVLLNDRDIAMQVASPGIDRAIKNDIEYSVFVGRGVRVLCASTGDWTAGIIQSATEAGVVIASDDTTHSIPFADIQKAKLDYSQEVR